LQRSKEAWTWLGRLRSCRYLSKEENNRFICLKASALIDQARFYEAQLCLHSGLQSSPNDISLLFLHSWVCLQRENYYCAANDYHKIIQLCPDYADAHYYLGWTYCALEAPRLMQNCFQLTYQLDSAKNQPLLFSRSDFQKLAEEALNKCFFWERGYSVQLAVEDLPPPSILDTYPYDPRKMGVFLQQPCFDPNAKKQPIGLLLIFQKNVERLLFTAKEIREGLMYFAHSEISGHPMFTIENTKDLRISNYGESS
jgi:tetratricopeptide (TPR) repeat protein